MQEISSLKLKLKSHLRLRRQRIYGKCFLPECAYCGLGIVDGPDMHEALFTKGDVSGKESLIPRIYDRRNCVLVHPGGSTSPCHAGAQTKEGQLIVIKHLIKWEGLQDLREYVAMMDGFMKGTQATQVNSLLTEASK